MHDDDLEPGITREEREQLAAIVARLEYERPVPAAAFRGALGRRLRAGETHARAGRFGTRRVAIGSLVTGAALLLLAALGLADAGPLAPSAADVVSWLHVTMS